MAADSRAGRLPARRRTLAAGFGLAAGQGRARQRSGLGKQGEGKGAYTTLWWYLRPKHARVEGMGRGDAASVEGLRRATGQGSKELTARGRERKARGG